LALPAAAAVANGPFLASSIAKSQLVQVIAPTTTDTSDSIAIMREVVVEWVGSIMFADYELPFGPSQAVRY
jgi:hypothetical protein